MAATQFPLAAPAGKDSNARAVAPAGAVNTWPFDPSTWKYGTAFNAPANAKVWNPVKLKMMQGGKVTGGTLFNSTDPAIYCAMANAGYDCIWTEMQHDAALKAGVRLCGPLSWRDRPDFTCFQAYSETAAIANGVRAELGLLANTQGKPEVGQFAPKA